MVGWYISQDACIYYGNSLQIFSYKFTTVYIVSHRNSVVGAEWGASPGLHTSFKKMSPPNYPFISKERRLIRTPSCVCFRLSDVAPPDWFSPIFNKLWPNVVPLEATLKSLLFNLTRVGNNNMMVTNKLGVALAPLRVLLWQVIVGTSFGWLF